MTLFKKRIIIKEKLLEEVFFVKNFEKIIVAFSVIAVTVGGGIAAKKIVDKIRADAVAKAQYEEEQKLYADEE